MKVFLIGSMQALTIMTPKAVQYIHWFLLAYRFSGSMNRKAAIIPIVSNSCKVRMP